MTTPDIPTTTLAEKWDNSVDAHKAAGATGNPWRGVAVDMYHEAEDLERRLAIACKIAESVERLRAAATARAEEAERWKSEALQVEREWDPQELAKMLGGTLGESCRMVVQREVPRLLSELDRLRKEREWQPIDELNKSEMQFVLVYQDGAMRTRLWNPRGFWEGDYGRPVGIGGECYEPTRWMPLPAAPKQEEGV